MTTNMEFEEDTRGRLWASATLTFGVGDLVTTLVGIALLGAVEANPLPAAIINEVGLWILVPLKALSLLAFAALYLTAPREWRVGVPIALTLVGLLILANNLHVLARLATA